jgi:hypothetical protein
MGKGRGHGGRSGCAGSYSSTDTNEDDVHDHRHHLRTHRKHRYHAPWCARHCLAPYGVVFCVYCIAESVVATYLAAKYGGGGNLPWTVFSSIAYTLLVFLNGFLIFGAWNNLPWPVLGWVVAAIICLVVIVSCSAAKIYYAVNMEKEDALVLESLSLAFSLILLPLGIGLAICFVKESLQPSRRPTMLNPAGQPTIHLGTEMTSLDEESPLGVAAI